MEPSHTTMPKSHVRRRDRAVNDEAWIREMLRRAPIAAIATSHAGEPYVNVNIFLYDEGRHAIYLHTARQGHFRVMVDGGMRACMSIHTMGRLLPAPSARNFSIEYEGVVLFGRISVVEDAAEKTGVLHALVAKYAPHLEIGRDYTPATSLDLRDTSVYRLDIEEWSGKRKHAPTDFPGAFEVPYLPFGAIPVDSAEEA